MTPKEKAKGLVGKFYVNIPLRDCDNRRAHKLALIAVDELIESWNEDLYIDCGASLYWQEVKQEIEKL
jgi:hypothetical protein